MSQYYRVYLDGKEIYDVRRRDKILINPVCKPSIEEAGSFEFTIDKSHKNYDEIVPYGSNIEVFEDGESIFYGRPLPPTKNLYNQITYHCEGAVAFLNDIICPPMSKYVGTVTEEDPFVSGDDDPFVSEDDDEFESGGEEDEDGKQQRTITLTQYIEYVFEMYNRFQTRTDRKLHLRNYNVEADATMLYDSDYKSCLEVLRSEILPYTGGYLVATHDRERDVILVDITNNFGSSNQPIKAGANLLDFSAAHKPFYTAVIAKGGALDNDYQRQEQVKMDEPVMLGNNIIGKYGVVCAYQYYPECTSMDSLMAKCQSFLQEQQFQSYSFDVNATDLHITNRAYDLLKAGKSVVFDSPVHGARAVSMIVSTVEIRLDTGEKRLSLGTKNRTKLTQSLTMVAVKEENKQEGTDIHVDSTPIEGSSNPVSSGGVYDALHGGGHNWTHQIDGVTQNTGTVNFITQ